MPSGHKAFLVNNTRELDMLLMHNRTYAAEYVLNQLVWEPSNRRLQNLTRSVLAEEGGDCCAGKAAGRQGHEREGES